MTKDDFFWAEGLGGFAAPGHSQKITHCKKKHATPELEPCEIDGRAGYWKAVHDNGLVQIVWGRKAEALAKVKQQVDRLNRFERWCRAPFRHTKMTKYF